MRKIEKFNKLHDLLDSIEEQESKISEERKLFEVLFNDSPIPMAVWSVCSKRRVLVQKGNGIINHDSSDLEELFRGRSGFETIMTKHSEAFNGNQIEFTHLDNNRTFQIKLIPVSSDNCVKKVMGMAIDVTPTLSKKF